MYQEQAERLYRDTTPYRGEALDNHCIRLAELALALGQHHGVPLDDDLVRAVAWLHDIGLMVKRPGERAYPRRGLAFIEPLLDGWNLTAPQRRVVAQMMLYNHSLRPLQGLSPQAEMLRRAVQVEHSLGVVRHGLDEATIKGVFARWPRRGLTRILADFARITLLHDGPGQLLPLFFPHRLEPEFGPGGAS